MQIWIIFPLLTFILFTFILYNQKILKSEFNFREALVISGIFFAFIVSIITEIFSFFNAVTADAIISFWFICCILIIALAFIVFSKNNWSGKKITLPSLSLIDKIVLLFLVVNIAFIALIAWTSPPCNWDSMVSNVARIMHWIQNQNLNVFPTNIESQFYYPPFAAIAIMQLQVLSGTDYLSNFIQFFSMLGCLILVSLIAKKLSPSINCQLFSIIICGTIPMLILQASSTQYELVLGFFILCFIYFIDEFTNQPSMIYSFLAGASLGLAIYTKPIAYVYLIPFIFIFIICIVRKFDFTNIKKSFAFWGVRILPIPISFLVLCAPYFYRNYEYFGNILGNPKGLVTIEFSFPKLLTNIFWNLGEHLQFIYPANSEISNLINAIVSNIDNIFLVKSTIFGVFIIPVLNFNEDNTGSVIHLILILAILLIILIFTIRKKIYNGYMNKYIFGIAFSFILYCLFFNYNEYNIRYQLPLFIMSAPLVGYILSKCLNRKISYLILIILLTTSIPWVVLNETKPIISYKTLEPIYPSISKIIGKNVSEIINRNPAEFSQSIFERDRTVQYFNSNRNAREPFMVLSKNISEQKYEKIGLDIKHGAPYDYEYPLWMLLKNVSGSIPRIEHVNVDNPSKNSQDNSLKDFKPDVIFSVKNGNEKIQIGEMVIIDNITYKKIKAYGNYSLLIPS
jgi:4-amino-4-deoxy-L-arabinose transferase-like glycosyltransferase